MHKIWRSKKRKNLVKKIEVFFKRLMKIEVKSFKILQ